MATHNHSKKLQFYSIFKHDYKISSYLDLTRNSTKRKDSVKIRTNNNKLMIETGRYNQTPHNDRFCPVCNSGIIEDEFHFLLHCPKYSIPREKCYNQIQHNLLIYSPILHRINNYIDEIIEFFCKFTFVKIYFIM